VIENCQELTYPSQQTQKCSRRGFDIPLHRLIGSAKKKGRFSVLTTSIGFPQQRRAYLGNTPNNFAFHNSVRY
jgi:hypothetical protein